MERYSSSTALLGNPDGDYADEEGLAPPAVRIEMENEDDDLIVGMAENLSLASREDQESVPDGVPEKDASTVKESESQTETPLPLGKMIPILLLTASESFNSSAIFAYVGYLVLDLGLTDDKTQLGNYAGLISSCFFVAQFLSSFFWGKMSDKYGRRPILLLGTAGTMLSALMFGFSMTLPFAVISRAICGLLNGNIGVLKTYLGEVTDSTNQTKAWSWSSLAAGIGAILGPLAGGILAQPAVKYPKLFADGHGFFNGVFEEFPYLLPNLVAVAVSGSGLAWGYFNLTENHIPRREEIGSQETYSPLDEEQGSAVRAECEDEKEEWGTEMKMMSGESQEGSGSQEDSEEQRRRGEGTDDEGNRPRSEEEQDQKDRPQGENGTVRDVAATKSLQLSGEEESTLEDKPDGEDSSLSSLGSVLKLSIPWNKSMTTNTRASASKSTGEKSVLLEGQVLLSTSLYGFTGMLYIFIDAVFPLWSMTDPKDGGLGFATHEIGITNSIGSLSIILIQLCIYGPLAKKLGLVNTFKVGVLAAIPIFMCFPIINFFHPQVSPWSSMPLMWALLIGTYIIRTFVGQLMFCAVMNLINNSVDVYHMGAANGLGQSLVALLRAIGPYFSSVIFAWSTTSGVSFPFNFYFVFVVMTLVAIFILGLSCFLHRALNRPKPIP